MVAVAASVRSNIVAQFELQFPFFHKVNQVSWTGFSGSPLPPFHMFDEPTITFKLNSLMNTAFS